jgi:small subunit ribosomal protein S20
MANKVAARKAMAQAAVRTAQNVAVRSRLKTLAKRLRVAISSGDGGVRMIAADYVSALDKAVKRHVIHRNSANRHRKVFAKYAMP